MIPVILMIALWVFTPPAAWSQALRGGRNAARAGGTLGSFGSASTITSSAGTFRPSFPGTRIVVPHSPPVGFHRRAPSARFIGANWMFSFGAFPSFVYFYPNNFSPFVPGYIPNYRSVVIIEVPAGAISTATPGMPYLPYQQFAPAPLLEGRLPGRSLEQLAPFDPTPQEVVDRMLALTAVRKDDVVYDLGAGDGRVVISAAKNYGVKAVGFEIDAGLVKLAREKVKEEKLESLVEIRQQDFMTANLSPATVVTFYLSYDGNETVKPLLRGQLKPGTRVVSYTFDMGDWQPKIVESYRDAAGDAHALYLWEMASPAIYGGNSH